MPPDQPPPRRGQPQPLTGGSVRFGPYWLDARIAVGGTAEVYLAHPVDPRSEPRKLVVKRMLPTISADPEGRTMFEREAKLHASVSHPNVVTVYGSGVADDGEPYLAMEYVDGCDAFRLLKRATLDNRQIPPAVAVHLARDILRGLWSVHTAKDGAGTPLGIIHRDVTPSNLYLGKEGTAKLGDFGIARSTTRMTLRPNQTAALKGKFAYLAPEQVAGEPFDHRADLFSLATVLAEMLIGQPLFPGSGQLAVLLSIRDCRIEPLHEAELHGKLPTGLFAVLERALSRDPAVRWPDADAFEKALTPFDQAPATSRQDLAELVKWVQAGASSDRLAAVRESVRAMRAARPNRFNVPTPASFAPEAALAHASRAPGGVSGAPGVGDPHERPTGDYPPLPSYVRTAGGTQHGPWTFARLVEAVATGTIGRGDLVDYIGQGFRPIEEIEPLSRFLPMTTVTSSKVPGPGAPDFTARIAEGGILGPLMRVLERSETGVLFVERPAEVEVTAGRKELYFVEGRLHHVASSNASELLGEYLVRRGKLARDELDLALAVLPRHGGRMGDTLIALGLVDPVDIFRAIRDQGRDRVADLFVWKQGSASFYRGQQAPHVDFPLDLDLPSLMLAGLEAAHPGDAALEKLFPRLDDVLRTATDRPKAMGSARWPAVVTRVLDVAQMPRKLREVMTLAIRGGPAGATAGDIARAVELLLAAKAVHW
jgi:serine/threonine-protein kinase